MDSKKKHGISLNANIETETMAPQKSKYEDHHDGRFNKDAVHGE